MRQEIEVGSKVKNNASGKVFEIIKIEEKVMLWSVEEDVTVSKRIFDLGLKRGSYTVVENAKAKANAKVKVTLCKANF